MKIEGVSPFSVADNKDDRICPTCTKPNLGASENGSHRCLPENSVRLWHWGILTPNSLWIYQAVPSQRATHAGEGGEDQLLPPPLSCPAFSVLKARRIQNPNTCHYPLTLTRKQPHCSDRPAFLWSCAAAFFFSRQSESLYRWYSPYPLWSIWFGSPAMVLKKGTESRQFYAPENLLDWQQHR